MEHYKLIRATLTVAILAAFASVNASAASFTSIATNDTEPSLSYFLDSIYGAGNYERISDDLDGVWTADDLIGAIAIGKMSAAEERLGICVLCDGTDSFLFGPMITEDGILSATLFDGTYTFGGPTFRWYDAAAGNPAVGTVYSDPLLNANGTDHMVTFAIKDRPGVFAVAFEDWLSDYAGGPSDRDFNDFIVEVSFAPEQPNTPEEPGVPEVPEPTSVALLGGALLTLGMARRSRRPRV